MNAIKQCGVVLLILFCFLLSGCQKNIVSIFTASEHTELLADGEYQPFNVPSKTMEALMELVEAEDTDYIYEVFSQNTKENTDDLYEKVQELIRFWGREDVSWEFVTGIGDTQRKDGVTFSTRSSIYNLYTNAGTYSCVIDDVPKSTSHKETMGFSSIKIYPIELFNEYGPIKLPGISIVYRAGDEPQDISIVSSSLEPLMQLTKEGNADDIYEMFSLTAKGNAEGLQGELPGLMDFLNEQVISWEPYTWTQNIETVNGSKATTQEMFFYLHTGSGLYRCDIREVLEGGYPVDVGFSSVSIFPALYSGDEPEYEDEIYRGYCTWGRENMGVSIICEQ